MTVDPFEDLEPFDVDLGPVMEPPDQSQVAGPADPMFGGLDVAGLAAELMEPAVRRAVSKRVDQVASEALEAALTPDVLDRLRASADVAAEAMINDAMGVADPQVTPPPPAAEEPPELYYGSTDEFVREYLRHVYKRRIDGRTTHWSARWWNHDEAIARLEAIWRAWEHLRLDPATGPSVWWRDHADPHMRVLLSSDGPFSQETDTTTRPGDPLPYQAPPKGLFRDVRAGEQGDQKPI